MDKILDLAERLGRAIADSSEASQLREARKALNNEAELSKLLREFQCQSEKIGKLEAEGKAVEVEDKHKLRDLHEKLTASDIFKELTAAQVEYVDLMRKVNEALQEPLDETEKD